MGLSYFFLFLFCRVYNEFAGRVRSTVFLFEKSYDTCEGWAIMHDVVLVLVASANLSLWLARKISRARFSARWYK